MLQTHSTRWYETQSSILKAASTIVFFGLISVLTRPLDFSHIGAGLDPSWAAAASFASRKHLVFGSDFVFTSGPLSILYHRQFDERMALGSIMIWSAYTATFAWTLSDFVWRDRRPVLASIAAICLISTIYIIHPASDIDSMMFICCALLLFNSYKENDNCSFREISLSFILSTFSLAKFSMLPISLLCVIISDVFYITRGRRAYCTLTFVTATPLLYCLSGGPLSAFPEFLFASAEVAQGYTAAMSLSGSGKELFAWILAALSLMITSVLSERRTNIYRSVCFWLGMIAILWFVFKAGFVRHDLHSLIAWSTLSTLSILMALNLTKENIILIFTAFSISLGASLISQHQLSAKQPNYNWSIYGNLKRYPNYIYKYITLLAHPENWLEEQNRLESAHAAALREKHQLPVYKSDVDMIPSEQSILIANELKYDPRPTIQEYTTYKTSLIERNRQFFESSKAPETLLFRPGSIDGRHPASAEGPLWPLFLSRYIPSAMAGDLLVLEKRKEAAPIKILTTEVVQTRMAEKISFSTPRVPAMVKISVDENILGRIANLIFKSPALFLELDYEDGTVSRYRFIPDIHRSGVLLAPLVGNVQQYGLLATGGHTTSRGEWPIKLGLIGKYHTFFYRPTVTVTFDYLDLTPLGEDTFSNQFSKTFKEHAGNIGLAISSIERTSSMLTAAPEGIFAHAPARISVPTGNARHVSLAFGIREGAYLGAGQTDGACFRVRDALSDAILFERCLDPRRNPNDRGTVAAEVDLAPGVTKIVAETACRAGCSWAWSYWSKIKPLD